MMASLCIRRTNQRKLKPSMGKMPNCFGLKASTQTTTMGANKNK